MWLVRKLWARIVLALGVLVATAALSFIVSLVIAIWVIAPEGGLGDPYSGAFTSGVVVIIAALCAVLVSPGFAVAAALLLNHDRWSRWRQRRREGERDA